MLSCVKHEKSFIASRPGCFILIVFWLLCVCLGVIIRVLSLPHGAIVWPVTYFLF